MARLPHQILSVKKLDSSANNEQVMQSDEFPVRPGQPDCDFFMKTGDCKYRAACRYNHPISRSSKLRLPPLLFKRLYSKSVSTVYLLHFLNQVLWFHCCIIVFYSSSHQQLNGQYPEQPRNRLSTCIQCALNESGLPLRPVCSQFLSLYPNILVFSFLFHHRYLLGSSNPISFHRSSLSLVFIVLIATFIESLLIHYQYPYGLWFFYSPHLIIVGIYL